jgi:hypothetical protein
MYQEISEIYQKHIRNYLNNNRNIPEEISEIYEKPTRKYVNHIKNIPEETPEYTGPTHQKNI